MNLKLNLFGEIKEIEESLMFFAKELDIDIGSDGIGVEIAKIKKGIRINSRAEGYRLFYGDKVEFYRALAMLVGYLKQGNFSVEICEEKKFESCGVMIDCSRNAVLKVDTMKDILCKMARMGLNFAMLYTEDTYVIDDYPYFGYMRGAYSKKELKEIDAFAQLLGIELVPCIQTLGHLKMVLRWPFAADIKDTFDALLVDEPKTYQFIEAMIKTVSECFTSKKIHIGMDEVHNIGLGNYLKKHGYENRFDILTRHLKHVMQIVEKYGLQPMMWSDMFFRLGSPTNNYYDLDTQIPADINENIPDGISMVYWDYYHHDESFYEKMIQNHNKLGCEVVFAGGLYTAGMGTNQTEILRVTHPALKACRKENISRVFATIWGDDGSEVSIYTALLMMQLYAEYNYYDDVSDEHLHNMFKICQGYDADAFMALEIDNYPEEWIHSSAFSVSKTVLYQDILCGLFDKNFEGIGLKNFYQEKLEKLKYIPIQKNLDYLFEYQKQLLTVLIMKCDLGIRVTEAYKKKDKAALKSHAAELETLYSEVNKLQEKFTDMWERNNKSFGLDRVDLRMGGLLMRIQTAIRKITAFADGKVDMIEELEIDRLYFGGEGVAPGKSLVDHQYYDVIASASSVGC